MFKHNLQVNLPLNKEQIVEKRKDVQTQNEISLKLKMNEFISSFLHKSVKWLIWWSKFAGLEFKDEVCLGPAGPVLCSMFNARILTTKNLIKLSNTLIAIACDFSFFENIFSSILFFTCNKSSAIIGSLYSASRNFIFIPYFYCVRTVNNVSLFAKFGAVSTPKSKINRRFCNHAFLITYHNFLTQQILLFT